MSNLIFKGQQNNYPTTSDFGEERSFWPYYGKKHEGIDMRGNKKTQVFCEINGVIKERYDQKNSYGKKLLIKTNLGYLTKELEGCILYQLYGHLFKYDTKVKLGKFIEAGSLLGLMGNSGNCYTKDPNTGIYVPVTEKQQNNENFNEGVHLHLSFMTELKNKKLLEYIKEKLNLKNELLFLDQWGYYYWLNPKYVYDFLNLFN
ncbi:MAG: M23 family metallopeptidase [Spirochaetes bacterium]|nr:M23 family metallopeptidase [Spirochaetota bacterium]